MFLKALKRYAYKLRFLPLKVMVEGIIKQALDFYEKEQEVKDIVKILWPKLCEFWNVQKLKNKMPKANLALVDTGSLAEYLMHSEVTKILRKKGINENDKRYPQLYEVYFQKFSKRAKINFDDIYYYCLTSYYDKVCNEVCISIDDTKEGESYGEELTHALRYQCKGSKHFYKNGEVDEWFGKIGQEALYLIVNGTELEFLFKKNPKIGIEKEYHNCFGLIKEYIEGKNPLLSSSFKGLIIGELELDSSHFLGYLNTFGVYVGELLKKDPDIIKKPNKYIRKNYFKIRTH